ncbi:MAG TPA: hypothetical protein VKA84_05260, partial [Gemmatimonadaceae bacterium]|nr:hypothetical protein [Gemmatimonadaceae bacterium]
MSRTGSPWRPLAAAAMLLACGRSPDDDAAQAPAPGGTWREVARTSGLVAYVDTARLTRGAGDTARLWLRYQYARPITVGQDTTTHFRTSEMRLDLHCPSERMRSREIRMETADGIAVGGPSPEQSWRAMNYEPGASDIFTPLCRSLGEMLAKRGSAATAAPSAWYEIVRTPEIAVYLDTTRLTRGAGDTASVWFRFEYPTPMTIGTDTSKRYRAAETRSDVHCPTRRARNREMRLESV